MRSTEFDKQTTLLIFDKGDEVIETLVDFAKRNNLRAAHFTAVGAFSECVLGYFDREINDYLRNSINEQVEVMSLIGNIAQTEDGKPKVHAHVVVGKQNGVARGGHLLKGQVWPTLEMTLVSSPYELKRKVDEETGLPLIAIE